MLKNKPKKHAAKGTLSQKYKRKKKDNNHKLLTKSTRRFPG